MIVRDYGGVVWIIGPGVPLGGGEGGGGGGSVLAALFTTRIQRTLFCFYGDPIGLKEKVGGVPL